MGLVVPVSTHRPAISMARRVSIPTYYDGFGATKTSTLSRCWVWLRTPCSMPADAITAWPGPRTRSSLPTWHAHRQPQHLRQVQDGQVQARFDLAGRSFLIDVQAHVTEGAGRDHRIRAAFLGLLEIRTVHRQRDVLLLQNDREPAALDLPSIVHRLRSHRSDDLLQRGGIFGIVEAEIPRRP